MQSHLVRLVAFALAALTGISIVRADVVTDWNATLEAALRNPTPSPGVQSRSAAIVNVAMFDAINGLAKATRPCA